MTNLPYKYKVCHNFTTQSYIRRIYHKATNPQPKKVGDGLFQACFAWCSSGGSHMGQQSNAAGRFIDFYFRELTKLTAAIRAQNTAMEIKTAFQFPAVRMNP